jgi:NADPH:quinone reductase
VAVARDPAKIARIRALGPDAVVDSGDPGTLQPVIGQTFPLDRANDAHAAIEARTVFGKTLLTA